MAAEPAEEIGILIDRVDQVVFETRGEAGRHRAQAPLCRKMVISNCEYTLAHHHGQVMAQQLREGKVQIPEGCDRCA